MAKEYVVNAIESHKVVVFSKSYCPYCDKAKNALSKFLKDFTVVELDERSDGSEIQQVLGEITGATSVPRVFVGGKFIGGGDDTAAKARNGQLELLLKECEAI